MSHPPVRVHVRHLGGADHWDHPAGDAAPAHIRRLKPGTTIEVADPESVPEADREHYQVLGGLVRDGWLEVEGDEGGGDSGQDQDQGQPVDTPATGSGGPETASDAQDGGQTPAEGTDASPASTEAAAGTSDEAAGTDADTDDAPADAAAKTKPAKGAKGQKKQ